MANVTTPRSRLSMRNLSASSHQSSSPLDHSLGPAGDVDVGDRVNVPGGMDGIVKFVGGVAGKQGVFVGVELSRQWAARGKNNGDVDGVSYFTTSVPGSGIFLPIIRAAKRIPSANSTPTGPSMATFRSASPALRPKSRPSLPRPESPLRRSQNISGMTPIGGRPSLNTLSHNRLAGPRFVPSPTPSKGKTQRMNNGPIKMNGRAVSMKDEKGDEVAHLRNVIQEKNDKIAVLTAEFDSHRADFRNTLDTLELASSETERLSEKRIEDLIEERRVLQEENELLHEQTEDVASVAAQLRQLEEVVQELEEGLEEARRGEAEARGETEFLRGEVERVRAELKRERELNHHANGMSNNQSIPVPASSSSDADKWCALCEGDGHDSISCPYEKP